MRLVLFAILATGHTVQLLAQSPPTGYLGASSCASSTCHGGVVGQGPEWNHAFSTWYARDPHAGAGLLLRDEDSRAIVHRLNPDAKDSPEEFDAVLRQQCISCHATVEPGQHEQTGRLDDSVLAEGVSCESCHGAAATWIESHIQSGFAGAARVESGMFDTESIVGRAETCVRCHVGSRSADALVRDMNHDLIAAGHPALRFDLLLYHENLPKHWSIESETESEFQKSSIRVRGVGRAINLAAAASLARERATAHLKDPAVPWPELAEYDCFACHQSLSMSEYLLPPDVKSRRRSPLRVSDGLPIWNSWHTVGQKELTRQQLEVLSPARADPQLVAAGAARLANDYRAIAAARANQIEDPVAELNRLRADLQKSPPRDWHQAASQYLKIDAAVGDLAKGNPDNPLVPQWRESLRQMERTLRFDPDRSPEHRAKFKSPARFDPVQFRASALNPFDSPAANPSGGSGQPTNQPQNDAT